MFKNKKKLWFTLLVIFLVLVILLIILLSVKSCNSEENMTISQDQQNTAVPVTDAPDSTPVPSMDDVEAVGEVIDIDDYDGSIITVDSILPMDCQRDVMLYIADEPGKPISTQISSQIKSDTTTNMMNVSFTVKPTASPPPSSGIVVLGPKADDTLLAGSEYLLEWEIDSTRAVTVEILYSTDDGESFAVLVADIKDASSYTITVPNDVSDTCKFRVSVYVGTAFLGYNDSPMFSIVSNLLIPKPTKTPLLIPLDTPDGTLEPTVFTTPTPLPAVTPNPIYSDDGSMFISQYGDGARYVLLDFDIGDVDHIVWQLSRIPFSCDEELDIINPPGLLASGLLPGNTHQFNVDFSSIISNMTVSDTETPSYENTGVPYVVAPDTVLPVQTQQSFYMRAILFDEDEKVVGVTGSGYQLMYGKPSLDITSVPVDGSGSQYQPSEISIKDVPGFVMSGYEDIPDKGYYIHSRDLFDRGFMVGNINPDSVELTLQISTQPFKNSGILDFTQPSGLVYEDKVTGLAYTTVTRYYNISFADFDPELLSMGTGTKRYYLRYICYIPGEIDGTVIPIASQTKAVIFTGDDVMYAAGSFDPDDLEPEEVVVKSYVPSIDFHRYVPTEWGKYDADEYFEVTRHIDAEEVVFSIKNNKTGDFLMPYALHMYMYPGTTKAEYQEILDRMLPVGAWFHLTLTQSKWDAIWAEFCDLMKQIYTSIQEKYNGLKVTIANTVADRFAFLGPDVQSVIRTAVRALIDYGLASIGLPPSLPNFEALADQGLDYCVVIALDEAANQLGIPPDQIPDEVKDAITDEVSIQLDNIANMKNVNPLGVGYLKPATKAMYRPAFVDVEIFNNNHEVSPSGTMTVGYYPPGSPHFRIYDGIRVAIPSLRPMESTFIRVYLRPGSTHLPVYKEYYNGEKGQCEFRITIDFDVPDIEDAAAMQGAEGEVEVIPDAYVFDKDPHFEYRKINIPSEPLYD